MRNITLLVCSLIMPLGFPTGALAETRRVVLPSGSVIPVLLDSELSSRTARVGETFTATVRQGSDDAGMPEGTRIEGVIREAQRFENGRPGFLDLDFRRMVTPGGQRRTLSGSLIALNGKNVTSSEGRLVATENKSADRNKFIGIGAGGGLLIGALAKKDALLSTILGAGAGYLYNEFANKPKSGDVNLKRGTEFGIRLDRPFTFETNQAPGELHRPTTEGDSPLLSENRYARQEDRNNENDIFVTINDNEVAFDSAKPYLRNDQVMVPLEAISEAAHFSYRYNKSNRMVTARNGRLRMAVGSRVAVLNGRRRSLPAPCEIREEVVYVPLAFINLATGGTAVWDSDSRTAILTTSSPQ